MVPTMYQGIFVQMFASIFQKTLCPAEWEQAKFVVANQISPEYRNDPGLQVPNCSDTDSLIKFLNLSDDCCTNGGVIIPGSLKVPALRMIH